MKIRRAFLKVLEQTKNLILSHEYLCRSRIKPTYFTRLRKLSFFENMLFILSGAKNSLQGELNHYLDMLKRQDETYSKQAFSKGRQRIKPEAFKELVDNAVQTTYSVVQTQTWNGYHLLAIDGSRYNLPTNPETNEVFGVQVTGGAAQPQALGSCLLDILNGMIIDVRFGGCRENERIHAAEMICRLNTAMITNPLYIMDRGYPCSALMELIGKLGQHYLMRCDKTFLSAVKITGTDVVVTHKFVKGTEPVRFRLVTVALPNGEKEYLATNIFDGRFNETKIAELYRMRWGIETKYNDLKGKLQIENFTGNTPIAICQDFYATVYLANLAGVIALDYRDEIEALHNSSENLHTYKLNVNLTISALKQNVIELLLTDSRRRSSTILNKIAIRLHSAVVPIRHGRSFDRKRQHNLSKYPQNRKLP